MSEIVPGFSLNGFVGKSFPIHPDEVKVEVIQETPKEDEIIHASETSDSDHQDDQAKEDQQKTVSNNKIEVDLMKALDNGLRKRQSKKIN